MGKIRISDQKRLANNSLQLVWILERSLLGWSVHTVTIVGIHKKKRENEQVLNSSGLYQLNKTDLGINPDKIDKKLNSFKRLYIFILIKSISRS